MEIIERVQGLALGGLDELPTQFVRPAHERPENSKAVQGITVPVISISQPTEILVKEIYNACSQWGFFLLTEHTISPSLIGRLQAAGEEFFKLPQEEKEKYANDPSSLKFEGYGTKMTRNHDEKVEWEVTEEYAKELLKVTDALLELLSEGLGLERKALKSSLRGEEIELEMKINMYPPCPQPQLALGVEPHTDMSALTILVPNDVPGLQVWNDHNWVAVDYLPNDLFIHVGDQIEVLSNGKYMSVLHRSLVNKDRMRMSWAVFCTPPLDALIGPLPQLVNDENPSKYSTKTYEEYRYRKFNKIPQ
ncbi:hypothetical protein HHK36_004362 [Tetracentron sinense]|uniref:Fe2OG dioxygenase domain-containing protein n=1 Tax=Tetracentron sinense TaxID=13715 RepID=A0A834ZV40_TETSI|nr:hypothetical protein HHK36_004362 [Tetracentron sinense]